MKNNEKGITLIALIITIIVMLILVGVTINVALNGRLFEKTKDATTKTQKEVEKEELISAVIGAYSSKNDSVTLSDLISAIDTTKFKYDSEKSVGNSTYVVEGKKSGTIWKINLLTGEVKEYGENNIEYYSGIWMGMDAVVLIDYDNKIAKSYIKNSSDLYEFLAGSQFTLPNTFTVYFNENQETESNGGNAFYAVSDDMIIWYKRNDNGLLYLTTGQEGNIRTFDSENYISLNNNFDTSLLSE